MKKTLLIILLLIVGCSTPYEKGEKLIESGRWDEAISEFSKITEESEQYFFAQKQIESARLGKSKELVNQKKWDEALLELLRISKNNEQYPEVQKLLSLPEMFTKKENHIILANFFEDDWKKYNEELVTDIKKIYNAKLRKGPDDAQRWLSWTMWEQLNAPDAPYFKCGRMTYFIKHNFKFTGVQVYGNFISTGWGYGQGEVLISLLPKEIYGDNWKNYIMLKHKSSGKMWNTSKQDYMNDFSQCDNFEFGDIIKTLLGKDVRDTIDELIKKKRKEFFRFKSYELSETSLRFDPHYNQVRTYYYFKSKQKSKEITFMKGVPNGKAVYWYKSGQKLSEGTYKDGLIKDGFWTYWYENGQQKMEGTYTDNEYDGLWTEWYENGYKEKEGSFVAGEKGPKWLFWDKNGKEIVTVTDIDGNIYKTIKIGEQWWMAENLKVTRYRNGEPIPHLTTKIELSETEKGAYCIYKSTIHPPRNDENIVETYGLLYNGYAVNDMRGLAPEGWHVPSSEEWKQLEMYLGMTQDQADYYGSRGKIAGKLKEMGTNHWRYPNTGASNQSGFTALPAGEFYAYGPNFWDLGYNAGFWSTSDRRQLYHNNSKINIYSDRKVNCHSVRCIKD